MDDKVQKLFPAHSRFQARRSVFAILALGVAAVFLGRLYFQRAVQSHAIFAGSPSMSKTIPESSGNIKLEAHIMSKCPDARDCLRDLIVPAMVEVSSLVDFKLSFIATPIESNDGVECKHGPDECLGNMLELCAAKLYPDPKLYLGFTLCLSNQYNEIPKRELVQYCSSEHGIEFEKLNDCVSDTKDPAIDLLKASAQHSRDAGVLYSCTVRLQEKVWCVRDNEEWKDCPSGHTVNDLIEDIRKAHKSTTAS